MALAAAVVVRDERSPNSSISRPSRTGTSITLKHLSQISRALKRSVPSYRRFHASCYAWSARLRPHASHSQWGEDRFILDYLNEHGGVPSGWIYVDVGANHPTHISDTFLFYRLGYTGVCLEPNLELAELFGRFRPRDTMVPAAAAARGGVGKFYVTENPVFSSLSERELEDQVLQVRVVPVIALDDLLKCLDFPGVFLLKVDTEGYDREVLQGATSLLHRTMIVLTETRSDLEREEAVRLLGPGWNVIWARANTVFVNQRLFAGHSLAGSLASGAFDSGTKLQT